MGFSFSSPLKHREHIHIQHPVYFPHGLSSPPPPLKINRGKTCIEIDHAHSSLEIIQSYIFELKKTTSKDTMLEIVNKLIQSLHGCIGFLEGIEKIEQKPSAKETIQRQIENDRIILLFLEKMTLKKSFSFHKGF